MMMKKDDYLRYYKKENKCYIYSILGAKSIWKDGIRHHALHLFY
jgi:hypothetical protein